MFQKRKSRNKRGSGEELMMPEIVLLLATLMIFGAMLFFIAKLGSSALLYEEVYAKEIALIIENSVPGQTYELDVTKAMEIAGKEGISKPMFAQRFIKISDIDNNVIVRISSKGGYDFVYFSKVKLSSSGVKIDNTGKKATLILEMEA